MHSCRHCVFRILLLALALLLFATRGAARPVTPGQVRAAVLGWLKLDARPLGAQPGHAVRSVVPYADAAGAVAWYVVALDPAGFVIVAADDDIEPIIGFTDNGAFAPVEENPLYALARRDLPNRMLHAQRFALPAVPGAGPRTPAGKWQWLTDEGAAAGEASGPVRAGSVSSVSDERVAPLVQSKWDQGKSPDGKNCYNCYTPKNYVCGCVATAMAQLMRYHQHPTTGVGTATYDIEVDGSATTRDLRGGDEAGGAYAWGDMVLAPTSAITETQRKAIGALTQDAGVSVNMSYKSSGSAADTLDAATAFTDVFAYGNAIKGLNGYNNIGAGLTGMANPNLDAGLPVLLGITGTDGGHAIVCDGYGYQSSTLYHHLNLGWSGTANAWYNLPTIETTYYDFTSVYKCVYNVYTAGSGEIVSGRVLDAAGSPVSGATVVAKKADNTTYQAQTNARGIYALVKLPSSTNYTITASKSGYSIFSQSQTTGQSSNNRSTAGNLWGINFTATPYTTIRVDGSGLNGDISSSTDEDIYEFTTTAQQTIVIETTTVWGGTLSDSYLTLRNGNGTDGGIQQSNDDGGDGLMSRIVRTIPAGTYRVVVKGFNGATGTYTVSVSSLTTLTAGTPANGNIDFNRTEDWYTFTVASSGTYLINTTAGSLTDNYLYLYDSNHNECSDEDDDDSAGNMAFIEAYLSAGTYYLKVRGYAATDVGTYGIVAAPVTTLTLNGASGSVNITTTGDEDWFKFTVASADTCVIETTNEWGTLSDSIIMLYDSGLASIEEDDDHGDGLQSRIWRGLNAATYYVRVRGFNSATGTCQALVNTITTLTVDAAATNGNIGGSGAADWYKFVTASTGTYVINTSAGTLKDDYLFLYDSSHDESIEEDDDDAGNGMARITRGLESGRFLYLKIDAFQLAATGTYAVSVGLVPSAPSFFSHNANTTGSITWTWQDNSGNESGFRGHDAADAVKWTAGASAGSCTESGLSANTQYTRHAHAYNAAGDSAASGQTSAYTAIQQPTGIVFGTVTATSIQVCSANTPSNLASGASGLQYYNATDAYSSVWRQNNNYWTDDYLQANTQYAYRVKARNGNGDNTGWSSPDATKYTLPASPSVLCNKTENTPYVSGTSFTFANMAGWASGGVDHYHYLFDTHAATAPTSADAAWSANNLVQTPADGSWYLHVLSHNPVHAANGTKHYGPFLVGSIPAAPINFSHNNATAYAITWTWQDNSNNETGFRGHDGASALQWTAIAGATSFVEGGLSPNTQYTRHAHAFSAVGESGATSDDTACTLAAPPTPPWAKNLTPTSARIGMLSGANPPDTEVAISLSGGAQAGYVQGDGSLAPAPYWWPAIAWGSPTVTGLMPGTAYQCALVARNRELVETPPSQEIIFTTPTTGAPPAADFALAPAYGPAPLAVQFGDLSNGAITAWHWTFGDGGESTEREPLHAYTAPGDYDVALVITGPTGTDLEVKAACVHIVDSGPRPAAMFTADPSAGMYPLQVAFTDASTGDIDSWSWDFGDGGHTTGRNPTHLYQVPGVYTVRLTVAGVFGSDSREVPACVVVDSVAGHPPAAAFSAAPTTGAVPLTVQFTDLSTGQVDDWRWDFGDGEIGTAQHPLHEYAVPGVYTVRLTVANAFGNSVEEKADYVAAVAGGDAPVAAFSASPTGGACPLSVQFTDASTGASAWHWLFGDGTESEEQHPLHQYALPGLYTVVLTARGEFGEDEETKTGYIAVDGVPPEIVAQPQDTTANQGDPVSLSVAATGTAPLAYRWMKGDFPVEGATAPVLTFAAVAPKDAGSYLCVVTNDYGQAHSEPARLVVLTPPEITRQPDDATTGVGASATFTVEATGTPELAYQWRKDDADLPGATASTLTLDPVGPDDAGSYRCRVTNAQGEAESDPAILTVVDPPLIIVQPESRRAETGADVTFSVTAAGTEPLAYLWYHNDDEVPGSTAATCTITHVGPDDAGSYRCRVSNAGGAVLSESALLTVSSDIAPPAPDPPSWQDLPHAESDTIVHMTVFPVTDPSLPVQYLMQRLPPESDRGVKETAGSGVWQDETSWTDAGLLPNTRYGYRIKARDSADLPNETAWAAVKYACTLAATPDVPLLSNATATAFDVDPGRGENPSATLLAIRVGSRYVQADGSLGDDPCWQPDGDWALRTVTGLAPATPYMVDVQACNDDGIATAFGGQAIITTLHPPVSGVTLAADAGNVPLAGYDQTFHATPGDGESPEYAFTVKLKDIRPDRSYSWVTIRDDGTTFAADADCVFAAADPGIYTVAVTCREAGTTAPLFTDALNVTIGTETLTGVSLAANMTSGVALDDIPTAGIRLTAGIAGTGAGVECFFSGTLRDVDAAGTATNVPVTLSTAWGGNTCQWRPADPGYYTLRVTARDATCNLSYTAYLTFLVRSAALKGLVFRSTPLSGVALNMLPPGGIILGGEPVGAGTGVEYFFSGARTKTPEGAGVNEPIALSPAWSADRTCAWTPTLPGTYLLTLTARDATCNTSIAKTMTYQVRLARLTGIASLTADPPSGVAEADVPAGGITLTTAPIPTNASVEYFYAAKRRVYLPSGAYDVPVTLSTAYQADPAFTWLPPQAGMYIVTVTVRDKIFAIASRASISYLIRPASLTGIADLTAVPPPGTADDAIPGEGILLTATPEGSGAGAHYFFAAKLKDVQPDGSTVVTPVTLSTAWSGARTFAWHPDTPGNYTITVQAKDADYTVTFSRNLAYLLKSATVTGIASFTPNLPSGTALSAIPPEGVLFTTGIAGSGTGVRYRYQVGKSNGASYVYGPLTDYTPDPAFAFQPAESGVYRLWVFAYDGTCNTSYSKYAGFVVH